MLASVIFIINYEWIAFVLMIKNSRASFMTKEVCDCVSAESGDVNISTDLEPLNI